jgi:hypothetical protein
MFLRPNLSARQPGRAPYSRHAAALVMALVMFSLIFSPAVAWAVIVPAGSYTFDGNLPGNGFVSLIFDGINTRLVTPALAPTATFGVAINPGALQQNYPLSSFHITGGFNVTSAFVFDAGGTISVGDPIFASIGSGSFDFTDTFGTILSGSFTSATFTTAQGATAGSLSTSDINGLVLTPGPAFTFDTSFVSSIALAPTGFSISLSSIPGGVTASGPPAGLFIPATILPFSPSSGSAVVSGAMTVVPEPGTLALLSFGALALATPAYRRWRRKTPRASG